MQSPREKHPVVSFEATASKLNPPVPQLPPNRTRATKHGRLIRFGQVIQLAGGPQKNASHPTLKPDPFSAPVSSYCLQTSTNLQYMAARLHDDCRPRFRSHPLLTSDRVDWPNKQLLFATKLVQTKYSK